SSTSPSVRACGSSTSVPSTDTRMFASVAVRATRDRLGVEEVGEEPRARFELLVQDARRPRERADVVAVDVLLVEPEELEEERRRVVHGAEAEELEVVLLEPPRGRLERIEVPARREALD